MNTNDITFTNSFGELLLPLLIAIRSTGFFEAYVFMPVMTLLAVAMFLRLRRQVNRTETFSCETPRKVRFIFEFAYFTLCFLMLNALAVAFKTFIVQELDYEEMHWYIPYVAPLHFYIVSVAAAHLYLVWKKITGFLILLILYIQIGLIAGYYIAVYRLVYEPMQLTDVTTGLSGIVLIFWCSVLNLDLYKRFLGYLSRRRNNLLMLA